MTDQPTGFVLVDKPAGPTSHDVVALTRRRLKTRRVGHAGTLDPMATGLLICGVGRATRLLTHLVGLDKTYEARIRLGEATATDDADGEVIAATDAWGLRDADITAALEGFRGDISQRPSAVSAIKVDGKRAYDRVRAGEDVELAPRPVTIHDLEVMGGPATTTSASGGVIDLDVRVRCSSGTYIRAIARDLGAALGCGGHLTALRRTAVGPFSVASAGSVDDAALVGPLDVMGRVLPVRQVGAAEARDLGYGRFLAPTGAPGTVAAARGGDLLALLEDREGRARPVLVVAGA